MKVVLTRDVKDLGSAGQVKEVADGYARNFLFPRKLAVPATGAALKQVEAREQATAKREARVEDQARQLADRLKGQPLRIFPKVGEQGRLYGSVTAADVADALAKQIGQAVDKRKIELTEPIRQLGEYKVPFRITRTVTVTLDVLVERETTRGR
jgi:large subunit ribosomal protein L9